MLLAGGRLQFAFTRIDPNDHDRVFFFTLKIEDNKYQGMHVFLMKKLQLNFTPLWE